MFFLLDPPQKQRGKWESWKQWLDTTQPPYYTGLVRRGDRRNNQDESAGSLGGDHYYLPGGRTLLRRFMTPLPFGGHN